MPLRPSFETSEYGLANIEAEAESGTGGDVYDAVTFLRFVRSVLSDGSERSNRPAALGALFTLVGQRQCCDPGDRSPLPDSSGELFAGTFGHRTGTAVHPGRRRQRSADHLRSDGLLLIFSGAGTMSSRGLCRRMVCVICNGGSPSFWFRSTCSS